MRPLALSLGLLPLLLAACGKPAPDPNFRAIDAETLVATSNCFACHAAEPAAIRRIAPMGGPRLIGEGSRVAGLTPSYVRRFLLAPRAVKPGTRMPDVLHGLAEADRDEAALDLTHFLLAQAPDPGAERHASATESQIAQGRSLYRTIGCAVCHGEDIDRARLASMTDRDSLAKFLRDPLASRPCGEMPSLSLTEDEAIAIASWLVEPQGLDESGARRITSASGLRCSLFEREMGPDGVPDDDHDADQVAIASHISVDAMPHREDEFHLRFEGQIEIPRAGTYRFWLGSDDGSRLWLDGRLAIDNGGIHSMFFKEAEFELAEGWHDLRIDFWEAQGDDEVELDWAGPGFGRQQVPATRLAHRAIALAPPDEPEPFTPDPARVERGRARFDSLGCAACHVQPAPRGPTFAELGSTGGCLADRVPANVPDFGLSTDDRAKLMDVVEHALSLSLPLAPNDAVLHATTRLGCLSCHARDGFGGPSKEASHLFVADGDAELGDEGRLPPQLDDVGDKLRREAIDEQLTQGVKTRPYMLTRMPVFGREAADPLIDAFVAADAVRGHEREPVFSAESADTGRLLVGTTGVTCITCHTARGRASLGVPAVDLASMHRRIRPGWFLALLEDPTTMNPGTRMTRFWMPNERIFPQYASGDPKAQREAIWNYLSLGESMPLPPGIQAAEGQYELVPGAEPILFGTFMRGVSPRTICVGYPELLHAAYDAQHARLAKAWRGPFMDAEGTWHARAGQLEDPAAKDVIDMPPGDAIAVLPSRGDPWPEHTAQYAGVERDASRRPGFLTRLGEIRCTEHPLPHVRPGGASLVRQFDATAPADRSDVFLRAAIGDAIVEKSGAFVVDERVTVAAPKGAFVRARGDTSELLVPVDFKYVEGAAPNYRARTLVEYSW